MLDEGRMPAAVNAVDREECLEELLAFTQEKNVHARLTARG